MKELTAVVPFPNGLHGRPASELALLARGFESSITVHKGGRSADAARLMALMTLCVQRGDTVSVTAQGPDEEAAIQAVRQFFGE